MTVRQVFYQATVVGLVEKTETGYGKVQTDLVQMRRAGALPYGWLADNTRWQRKPDTFGSIQEALDDTAHFYRKALWRDADAYVEVWLEKDALAGVVYPVTERYDVPLMVARGYASLSFLHSAAEYINDLDVPAYIYHLGDFDPSGVNAGEKIEETLRELAPDADITFERIAVTPKQIKRLAASDAADQDDRQPREELRRDLGRARRHRARSGFGNWLSRRSTGTCRKSNFASSRPPRRASASCFEPGRQAWRRADDSRKRGRRAMSPAFDIFAGSFDRVLGLASPAKRAEVFAMMAREGAHLIERGDVAKPDAVDHMRRLGLAHDLTEEQIQDGLAASIEDPFDAAAYQRELDEKLARSRGNGHLATKVNFTDAVVILDCLADIEARPVVWLWQGRLARGKVTLLSGDPAMGKSQIAIDIAARISTGSAWFDGGQAPRGSTIILSAEDAANDTIKPRLEAAGADTERIFVLKIAAKGGGHRTFNIAVDLDPVRAKLVEVGDVVLIIIDP